QSARSRERDWKPARRTAGSVVSIRAPAWERQLQLLAAQAAIEFQSALLRRSDALRRGKQRADAGFNPRSHAGATPNQRAKRLMRQQFQSALLFQERRVFPARWRLRRCVSIHAPARE